MSINERPLSDLQEWFVLIEHTYNTNTECQLHQNDISYTSCFTYVFA